jgi:hypothetical protein
MATTSCVQCTRLYIAFWNGNTIMAPALQKLDMFKFPLFLENKLQLKPLFLDKIQIFYGEFFYEIWSFIQALCDLCIVLGRWRAKQRLLETCRLPVLNTEIHFLPWRSHRQTTSELCCHSAHFIPGTHKIMVWEQHVSTLTLMFTNIYVHSDSRLIFHWKEGGNILLSVFAVLLLLSQLGCTWIKKLNWLWLVCSNITPSWRTLRTTKTVGLAWQFRIQQRTAGCSVLSQRYLQHVIRTWRIRQNKYFWFLSYFRLQPSLFLYSSTRILHAFPEHKISYPMLFTKIWVKRGGRPPVRSSGVSRRNTDLSHVTTALLINVDNFYVLPLLFCKYFMVSFEILILKQKQYWTHHSDCLQVGELVINPQQSQHFVSFPPFHHVQITLWYPSASSMCAWGGKADHSKPAQRISMCVEPHTFTTFLCGRVLIHENSAWTVSNVNSSWLKWKNTKKSDPSGFSRIPISQVSLNIQ